MILRKPYAFLIKHFRFIHIILTVLMFIFFRNMRTLVEFFNEYIDLNTFENIVGVVSENFSIWYILLPVIIIAFIVIIMCLLIQKQKPIKYYLFSIIAYVIEIILLIVAYYVLITIQQGQVNANFILIFRDLIDALSYITIPFLVIALVRGVGFNVKQFNFKRDLADLDISEEDNEEFEVEVNVDTEDLKTGLNRRLRFMKYVYLENKLVFWSVGIIAVIVIAIALFIFIRGPEKIYKEKETFSAYGVNLVVDNSYKTKYASNGNIIKNDKFYIVVALSASNTLKEEVLLPYGKIYLRVDEENKFSPTDSYTEEFTDFGLRYVSTSKLKELEKRQIVLVYEIDNKYNNNSYRLEYATSEKQEGNKYSYDYAKIDLNPKEYKDVEKISEKTIGEVLTFDKSLIEGTEITILEEVAIENRFSYKYKQMIGNTEREFTKTIIPSSNSTYKKAILKLKVDLKKNENLNQKIYSSIFEKFATIEYKDNDKIVRQKPNIIDLTEANSEYTYLEVVYDVKESNYVALVFTVRDKEYKYILVNKEEK